MPSRMRDAGRRAGRGNGPSASSAPDAGESAVRSVHAHEQTSRDPHDERRDRDEHQQTHGTTVQRTGFTRKNEERVVAGESGVRPAGVNPGSALVVIPCRVDHGEVRLQAVPDLEAPSGRWLWEAARGSTRAVRVSPHPHSELVALSLWRDDRCVGSLRLAPAEVSSLIAKLSGALAEIAMAPGRESPSVPPDVAARLEVLEARLAALENPAG